MTDQPKRHDFRSRTWGHNIDGVQTREKKRLGRKPKLLVRGAGWSWPKPRPGEELIYSSADRGDTVVKLTEVRSAPGVADMFFWQGEVVP